MLNKVKKKIWIIASITMLLTACGQVNETSSEDNVSNMPLKNQGEYIHREGTRLIQKDSAVSLNAINFDNLTWYSETKMEDGTPVFMLHHSEKDYDTVREMGFNSIRYFIRWQDLYSDSIKLEKYDAGWKWLDQNIEWARQRNISLIIDFHCPYGGFGTTGEGTWPVWKDERIQSAYISAWKEIAQKYKNEVVIAGYDLMNEPSLPKDGERQYGDLLQKTISAIRKEDPYHLLIIEAAVGVEGKEDSWTRPTWVQVLDQNVMYSFHFYDPLTFTHNGAGIPVEERSYPDSEYAKEDLKQAFQEFKSEPFLKEYPLFLGEFGCNDWTEGSGAAQWISDVYKLCKENGIHTAFFTYRSFDDFKNKSDFSFAISRMYYNADTESGTEEYINNDILNAWK